jgi:hypothetical protein
MNTRCSDCPVPFDEMSNEVDFDDPYSESDEGE